MDENRTANSISSLILRDSNEIHAPRNIGSHRLNIGEEIAHVAN